MLLLRRKQALHSVASRLKRIGRWSKPCASCPIYIYPTRLSSITFGTTSVSRWIGSLFTFLELAWKLQDLVMFLVLFCSWMGFCFLCSISGERFLFSWRQLDPSACATLEVRDGFGCFGSVHKWQWWWIFPDASSGHCHPGNLGILSAPWQIPVVMKP